MFFSSFYILSSTFFIFVAPKLQSKNKRGIMRTRAHFAQKRAQIIQKEPIKKYKKSIYCNTFL
ncbi:MAG TPA: hypothetical protein DD657_03175 [Culturomica sp.]|nr:hypothetical protein [Culturomica sp.]